MSKIAEGFLGRPQLRESLASTVGRYFVVLCYVLCYDLCCVKLCYTILCSTV